MDRVTSRICPAWTRPDWSPTQTWLILGGLGASLAVVWIGLALLWRRVPGRSVPNALSISCAGTVLVLMLSAYATGGPLGIPLAAALIGAALVAPTLASPSKAVPLGVGVVGFFGILVLGRFFAS